MTISEANKLRDDYIKILVGRPYDGKRPDWAITDIIVSDRSNAENVYTKMHEANMNNEMALQSFSILDDNYDALIIAHQWPRGAGDILIESVQKYVQVNSI